MKWVALVCSFLPAALAAGQAAEPLHLEREAGGWVLRTSGAACPQAKRLKVVAQGPLTITGGAASKVSYQFARRASTPDKQQAARLLARAKVRAAQHGEWCVITTSAVADIGESAGELTLHIPAAVADFRLETRFGPVALRDLRGEIHASTSAGNVTLENLGGDVAARTGGGEITAGRIDGSLRCLSGGGSIRVARVAREAVLESAGGEIAVDSAGGPLRLSTSGNIRVGSAQSNVFAYTASGQIEVAHAAGIVTAESAGGGIQIGGASGVRCESSAGTIRMKNVSGSIRAATASGHIFAAFAPKARLDDSILTTGRGDITVSVSSNLAVTVKALNETAGWRGLLVSDFTEVRVQPAEAGASRPMTAEGSLNGGGPVLMLATSNGSIFLKRSR